jgi:type I restriction enzyme S subunit
MLEAETGGLPYINMKSFLKGGGFNPHGMKQYSGFYTPDDLVGDRDLLLVNTDVTKGDIVGAPVLLPPELAGKKLLYSHHVTRLRLDGTVTVSFLYYLLCLPAYRSWMLKFARGTTVLMLDMQAIKRIPVRAPRDSVYQDRITEILSTLDDAIEQTEALIAKYQQIKAGLMNDVFTRGVTSDRKLRPAREEAPTLYKESPLGWVPKEWQVATLSDRRLPGRAHLKTGPFGSSLKIEHWVEQGRPVITIGALGEGELTKSELLFVSEATAQRLREYQLEPGDVVFSRVADVGRSAVILNHHKGWIMSSNLMRISLDQNQVRAEYLQSQLAYDSRVRAQIRAKVNSGGREVANSQILNRLLFGWPQIEEQVRILDAVGAMEGKRKAELSYLVELTKQKIGLMQDLLTGRVRVNVPETREASA